MSRQDYDVPHEVGITSIARPPFDPSYKTIAALANIPPDLDVKAGRQVSDTFTAATIIAKCPNLTHRDVIIPPVQDLDHEPVTLALFETSTSTNTRRAVILFAHGGAQVIGNRFFGVDFFFNAVPLHDDVLFASVEYRLAPEHRAPAAAYDCYAAAVHLSEHAFELGIDASKLVVCGVSGGAGPAAATCTLARDRSYPPIRAQMLSIPMLDDRRTFASHEQFTYGTNWTTRRDRQAWDMVLGSDAENPTAYQVPSRASDLSGLPPAFIDIGECDVLRDGAVSYASRIWSAGGSCELHVWPGMYHFGMGMEPEVAVSKAAAAAEKNFLERVTKQER